VLNIASFMPIVKAGGISQGVQQEKFLLQRLDFLCFSRYYSVEEYRGG